MVWAWLGEENARLLLLGSLLLLYMCAGALIFRLIEEDYNPQNDPSTSTSTTNVDDYESSLNAYLSLQPNMSAEQLDALLKLVYSYGNSTLATTTAKPKWDFADGFHFAATIVSTIGNHLFFCFNLFIIIKLNY